MKLTQLSLVNFKNHLSLTLKVDSEVVAISGLNGKGKTNVLDALNVICLGKSYFSGTDVQCINDNKNESGIIAEIEHENELDKLKVKFKRGGRKAIERNGIKTVKLLDHIGRYFAVVIAPQDIELIYGANETRRTLVNRILSQLDRGYAQSISSYKKLIEHRNRHLKSEDVDPTLLESFDQQMAPLAGQIFKARSAFFVDFSTVFNSYYNQLSSENEIVEVQYWSQLSQNNYLDLTKQNLAKDIAVGRSFSGTHKDEISLIINGNSLKKYGSQGQIKSALIALKLAEYDIISKKVNKRPILLLDDIFEKIDDERAHSLTQIIKRGNFGQIFITDTNIDRLKQFCENIAKPYQHINLD